MSSKDEAKFSMDGSYVVDTFSEEVAKKLVADERFHAQLCHVDLEKVGFVRKICKLKKTGKITRATCRCIKDPVAMFSSKSWIITTMGDNFLVLPLTIKIRVVFHELLHISNIEGKVRDHDVEDFDYCLREWGLDWSKDESAPLLVDGVEDEILPDHDGSSVGNGEDMFGE